MKASELRIGNQVFVELEELTPATVIGIDQWGIQVDNDPIGFLPENVHPIPLTEEWLLKLGFVHINQNRYNHFEKNGVWIYLLYDKTFELELETLHERHNLCRQWKYVHQLQNLYFALTGEELNEKTI